jgi:septal ring factor EnvC (AmiA/AmiB activator)
MPGNRPLSLPRQEAVGMAQPQERKPKPLLARGELLILCAFVAISSYLTVKLALQTSRLAQFNTLHERSVTLINQQLKEQADHLAAFERTDRQVLQSLNETSLRNGRIETKLSRIEDDHMALKRANARILANEQKLQEQLDLLNARMGQNDASTTVEVPVAPSPAAPAAQVHHDASGLKPPQ